MNVIVSNKNEGLLNSLDIDVIKSINGQFDADEIIQTFSNFFFNRMFLDITALKNTNKTLIFEVLNENYCIYSLQNPPLVDIFCAKIINNNFKEK